MSAAPNPFSHEETIFVYGGNVNLKFVEYIIDLTGKPNPEICFLPTASGDNPENIRYWETLCVQTGIEPKILRVWVSSSPGH